MSRTEDHSDPTNPSSETLDAQIRAALEPGPGVADRVARRALAAADAKSESAHSPRHAWAGSPGLRWAVAALLVAAAGVALLLALRGGPGPSEESRLAHRPAVEITPAQPIPEQSEPRTATIRLSNESGFVTVTTTSGTQWVALPPAAHTERAERTGV